MTEKKKYKEWMQSNVQNHTYNGEVNITELAEACAMHFNLLTELGNSEPELLMFEVATEFYLI